MLFVTGFAMMVQMASSNTILQTIVDEDKRGRVMSFYTMAFLGMAPLGSLLAGGLADRRRRRRCCVWAASAAWSARCCSRAAAPL